MAQSKQPDQTKRDAPTKDNTKPSSRKRKWPDWARDVTAERVGETITIIGARQPPRKPKSG